METTFTARATTSIRAPRAKVWDALINPQKIKQYMFGSEVTSQWREGSPIVWKGEFQGRAYEDKGVILRMEPYELLEYSHFSPTSGLPDSPENYHHVTVRLVEDSGGTRVALEQEGDRTEQAREHSEQNWNTMLEGLKKVVET